jgi:DNA-binding transcriptional ArsR family regulator
VEGPVLLTAIGFKPELVSEPAQHVGASKIYGISTSHPKVVACREALERWSETTGTAMHVVTVEGAFDFVEWYLSWRAAIETLTGQDVVVNLTAGHAVAISTASLVAAQTSGACVCYDEVEDVVHHLNPSILEKLNHLIARDRRALAVLATGKATVGDVAIRMEDELSTVSRCLSRLREWGFVTSAPDPEDSRRQIYELRPGVREFLSTILI